MVTLKKKEEYSSETKLASTFKDTEEETAGNLKITFCLDYYLLCKYSDLLGLISRQHPF